MRAALGAAWGTFGPLGGALGLSADPGSGTSRCITNLEPDHAQDGRPSLVKDSGQQN